MTLKRLYHLLVIGLVSFVAASPVRAEVDARVVDRAAGGARFEWTTQAAGITGVRVSVRDATTGELIVPPFDTDQTSLVLPRPGTGDRPLVPDQAYEITLEPLPNGIATQIVVPPFFQVAPIEVSDQDMATLIDENNQDVTRRYAENDKLRAQAELLWSNRGWFKSWARHRIDMAIAADAELDVWTQRVSSYFDRREENLRGQMRVIDRQEAMNDQQLALRENAKRRVLHNLMNHPEMNKRIETSLDFLLSQFAGTPIGYGVGLDEYFATHPSHSRWDLTTEMLESIRVLTPKEEGGQIEFSLAEPLALNFDWWPPYLRQVAFRPEVEALVQSRDQLLRLSQQNPELPIEAIDQLQIAFAALAQKFYLTMPQKEFLSTEQNLELLRVEDHLGQLKNEITAVRARGNINAMAEGQYFDPVEDGQNAATLIAWMTRNGMTFAPPRPGTSGHYNNLLSDMKELMVEFGPEPLDPTAPQPKTNQPRQVGPPGRDVTTRLEP